jgi:D-alanyl-D-alanine carboxypeptidase
MSQVNFNMKAVFTLFIFIFILFNGYSQSVKDQIDSLLRGYYPADAPGAVVSVRMHGIVLFEKSYGLANLQNRKPITEHDNFNIGSLTKQFTAFAILSLIDEGKLSLTDSIGKYFKLHPPLSGVLISQLLDHSSGIPDHYAFTDTLTVKHATDKDVLEAIQKAADPYFAAGTHYRYSNTAYCLLGMLIEKVSGMSYPDYLEQQIFAPLGIKNATVFQFGKPINRRVTGYEKNNTGGFRIADAEQSVFFSTEADGGLYISMNDYQLWCEAIVSGRFSKTPMIRKAWQGQTLVDTLNRLWYGCGWFVKQPGSTDTPGIVYHTGFNGGFESVVWIIPSMDYIISIFSNRSDLDLEELVFRINRLLRVRDNSFIKSAPLESFIHCWPIFAPCKETSLYSTSFTRNWNANDMVSN